ncbi:hypothetical protein ACXGQW_01685 [Wenyingzhuangia sp. IMCC45533]
MIVSIGTFTLKKRTLLPEFLKLSKVIYQESLASNGNLKSELKNEGIKVFYSYTYWDSLNSMIDFVHSKQHGKILTETKRLCNEVTFFRYEANDFENIDLAIQKMMISKDKKVIKYT